MSAQLETVSFQDLYERRKDFKNLAVTVMYHGKKSTGRIRSCSRLRVGGFSVNLKGVKGGWPEDFGYTLHFGADDSITVESSGDIVLTKEGVILRIHANESAAVHPETKEEHVLDLGSGPLRPENVGEAKRQVFPREVFAAFNLMITLRLVGNSAQFTQDEVVVLMVKKGLRRSDIFTNGLLNVEEVYRSEGWEVEYDRPGFNETYPATFTFRKVR